MGEGEARKVVTLIFWCIPFIFETNYTTFAKRAMHNALAYSLASSPLLWKGTDGEWGIFLQAQPQFAIVA